MKYIRVPFVCYQVELNNVDMTLVILKLGEMGLIMQGEIRRIN